MLEKNDLTLISEVISEVIKEAIATTSEHLGKIDTRLDMMEKKISGLELTLENETNRNIKIIAEGHTDLSRKLDEALRVESEKELLLIKVNRLENEIRKLKDRIDEIA